MVVPLISPTHFPLQTLDLTNEMHLISPKKAQVVRDGRFVAIAPRHRSYGRWFGQARLDLGQSELAYFASEVFHTCLPFPHADLPIIRCHETGQPIRIPQPALMVADGLLRQNRSPSRLPRI
jgi:hypothetical protein